MFRRFLSYYRPYRGLLIFDIVTAMLHTVFILLIPLLVRGLLKADVYEDVNALTVRIVLLFGAVALMALTSYINTKWGHFLGARLETDMRRDLFTHLQKLSFSYYDNAKTGHLVSRMANDLTNISELAHHGPENMLISGGLLVGAFGVMLWFSPLLALIAFIPLPFIFGWSLLFGGRMLRGFRATRERVADINSSVENSIQGIREVKSFANEEYEILKFGEINTEFRRTKEGMYSTLAGFFGGMVFLMESYSIIVIAGGAVLVRAGRIDLADVVAFLLYVRFLLMPIRRLVGFVEQLQQGAASFGRFLEILDVEPEIVDGPGAEEVGRLQGEVRLEGVTFRYPGTEEVVLREVDLHVPAGRTVALVGESGAGKSTIAALIPRFYELQEGRVTIDGRDVREMTMSSLRRNIGIVRQDVFLFDSTIRENIMFGDPQADDASLVEAARRANILGFIEGLAAGFDTLVGERGVKLSGGQKQRISIARVFLKNPPILIFDEATSSLDAESEALIRAAMDELCRDRTTLVIAHRLSTVRSADRTYVLRGGELVEQGTHEELLGEGGYYSELYRNSSF
jgi:ATP-binding cassette subfamily B protein